MKTLEEIRKSAQNVSFTNAEKRAAINVLKQETQSLSGAVRIYKDIANATLLKSVEIKGKKLSTAQISLIMDITANLNILSIAAECTQKVGTTFAKEVTTVCKHYIDTNKSFDKSNEIKPLAGTTFKDFGFVKPFRREDSAVRGYIINVNNTKTMYRESVYIERRAFSPMYVLECLFEYIKAGLPDIKESEQKKAKRAKVAAAKKANEPKAGE